MENQLFCRFRRMLVAAVCILLLPSCSAGGKSSLKEVSSMSGSTKEAVNLASDGGFENSTGLSGDSWTTYCSDPGGDVKFSLSGDNAHSGAKSGMISSGKTACNACITQNINVEAGKTYTFECFVRTEKVSAGGSGAEISAVGRDDGNSWMNDMASESLFGDNGWKRISKTFTVPSGETYVNFDLRLWGCTGTVWFDDAEFCEYDATAALNFPSAESKVTLASKANVNKLDSFGAEWDPEFWMNYNTSRGTDENDWNLIARRIEKMGLQRVRMMVVPEWYEPHENSYDFDSAQMTCMKRYLDVCQKNGIRVAVTWWCAETKLAVSDPWLGYDSGNWCSAPNDLNKAAENVCTLLEYLKNQKKYTCITDLILMNEPNDSFLDGEKKADADRYAEFYKKVDALLKQRGLRGNISLIASDDANCLSFFSKSVNSLSGTTDKFDSHIYTGSVIDPSVAGLLENFVSQRTGLSKKPFIVGEFGTGNVTGAYTANDVGTYERGLFMPCFAINSLKAGGAGAWLWCLHDVYYYSGDPGDGSNGGLMKTGLWGYKNTGWAVRPAYYSWSLITRYARAGSSIYDITGTPGYLDMAALKSPEGKWTILAVNRSLNQQTVTINNAGAVGSGLAKYLFSKNTLPKGDGLIDAEGKAELKHGRISFTLPGSSFIVLSNI